MSGQTYQFDLRGSPTSDGTLVDPYMSLRDSSGTKVAEMDDGGTGFNSRFTYVATTTGDFFVAAGSNNAGIGTYKVAATNITVTGDAGNNFASATTISIGALYNGSVGVGIDTDDYLKFTASGNGFITANLSGLSADIDLRAYGSRFGVLATSELGGTANESIRFEVIGGQTYYLRVDPYLTASSNYNLATNFAPADASTLTTSMFFLLNGGQLSTLAKLADASYDLATAEVVTPSFNEGVKITGTTHGDLASLQPRWLTTTDLPMLSPTSVPDAHFPAKGLLPGGIYVNGNAAALIGVTSDALFLTFRGTNDNSAGGLSWLVGNGTPDTNDWIGKEDHYALLAQLIAEIDKYINAHPEIKVVYVSGHSLGAAMAQHYMEEHANSTNTRYESVLFASPGYGLGIGEESRISNIWLDGDVINVPAALSHNSGDDNTIYHNIPGILPSGELHHVWLYADFTAFLSKNGISGAALSNLGGIDYDRYYAYDSTIGTPGGIGEGNDVITGSGLEDVILGGAGNDVLNGGVGTNAATIIFDGMTDRLYGGTGDDVFIVNEARDFVIELASAGLDTIRTSTLSINLASYANVENIQLTGTSALNATGNAAANRLTGNQAANTIVGGAGMDTIVGGRGNDILTGGADSDRFVFNTMPFTSFFLERNTDQITDFNALNDHIDLENSEFTALGLVTGTLAVSQFWSSLTGLAHTALDRIIYETDTGSIFYDSDGNGSAAAVRLAILTNLPAGLGAEDFLII